MFSILEHVVWIDQDIVKVYNYADVEKIQEDVVYELLKGC